MGPFKSFYFGILMHIVYFITAEDVVKCIQSRSEKIRISCPHGHVIYKPSIMAGVSSTHSCSRDSQDCTGVPQRLQKHIEKCYWKKSCEVTLLNTDTIMCGNEIEDSQMNISYVVLKKMYCVPKDFVHDICNIGNLKKSNTQPSGIIRSHRQYPKKRPRFRDNCETLIPIAKQNSLLIEMIFDNSIPPIGLELVSIGRNNCDSTMKINDLILLHGNTTRAVKIKADFRWKRRHLKGFVFSFNAYRSASLDRYLAWPRAARPALRELGWIFEVRPVIEQCAVDVKGYIDLTCDEDEVIYFPAVSATGYTRRHPKCIFGKYPCGGLTPELMVQGNNCYWKNSCNMQWNGLNRIVLSKDPKCIGYSASTIGISGHRCVHKDSIYDICTDTSSAIDAPWGIIRSHPLYPWFIDSSCSEYKRTIKIGRKHALTLAIQDMNLDPDGRDKFFVYHVTNDRKSKVLETKSAMEGTTVQVKEGELIIKYKRFKRSKSGRGFILVFHRFAVSRRDSVTTEVTNNHNNGGVVSDVDTSIPRRLSNWRLCSKRGKLRKQGRACHRRVWTDYFTRLE